VSYKYFGEFLIHKKVIAPEALVGALIDQIKDQPPLCHLVYNKKLLSAEQMVSVFRYQQDHNADFLSSCQQLGLWDETMDKILSEEISRVRRPLGEILINRGDIDLSALTKMLDEYLSQAPTRQEQTQAQSTPAPAVNTPAPKAEETIELQPGLVAELEEVFDERKYRIIKVAMSFIKDKSTDDAQGIQKLFRDSLRVLHTINGLLSLLGLKRLELLITAAEQVVELHLKSEADSAQNQRVANLVYHGFEEAWKIRSFVLEHCSEGPYFQETANKNSYDRVIADLNNALGDLL
jgi:hypothetical protein